MSWLIKNNKLQKEFSFKSQTELAIFMLKIAQYADEVSHHPDIQIYKCSFINIELFTHETNTISEKDYQLAKFIDTAY
jgi:4a-hydroxytetrahydrobiopterin dehydratase